MSIEVIPSFYCFAPRELLSYYYFLKISLPNSYYTYSVTKANNFNLTNFKHTARYTSNYTIMDEDLFHVRMRDNIFEVKERRKFVMI